MGAGLGGRTAGGAEAPRSPWDRMEEDARLNNIIKQQEGLQRGSSGGQGEGKAGTGELLTSEGNDGDIPRQ